MPIDWTISHDDQAAEVLAKGLVGLPDIERYFDAVTVAGAWPYRKLFNAVHATPAFSKDDRMMLRARISAEPGADRPGHDALVSRQTGSAG